MHSQLYFCTDRYIWKWSEEPVNLPYPWSDSSAVSFDPAAVPGLARTIMMVYSGCQQDSQPTDGQCSNLTSDSYLYSPTANEFKQGAVMADERWRFAATNVSEHVYVFGGRNISDSLQCTVQVYDVLMNEWSVMPASSDWKNCTSDGAAFSVGGVIYLVGGYTADYESKATVTKVTITKDAAGKS
jgi:Kelch motif